MPSLEFWPGCTACRPQRSHQRNHSKASSLLAGATGKPTTKPLSSMMTPSSPPSPKETNTDWSLDLLPPSKPMTSNPTPVHQQLLHQYLAQSAPPMMWWLRPIGLMTSSAQYMTPMGSFHWFYSKFWKGMPTLTPVRSHKRPSAHKWFMACSILWQHQRTSPLAN